MKTIQLTRGFSALVDDDDYERLAAYHWHVGLRGYAARSTHEIVNGKRVTKKVLLHRVVANAANGEHVDHLNGDKLDCRKTNLRLCSNAENVRNRGPNRTNTSGFKGVTWNKQKSKWQAQIKARGVYYRLGLYVDLAKAAEAYREAAVRLHGDFARTEPPARDVTAMLATSTPSPRRSSKLTSADVASIKAHRGFVSQDNLAEIFGVRQSTISRLQSEAA